MALDLALISHTLRVLVRSNGDPRTERSLIQEVELEANRPVLTADVQDALNECQRQGWAAKANNRFLQTVWSATPAGVEQSRRPLA